MTEEFGRATEVNPGALTHTDREDQYWVAAAHAGGLLIGFLAPLVVMVTRGARVGWVREQAVEALNFQLTVLIAYVGAVLTFFAVIGGIVGPVVVLADLIFSILGASAALKGESFRYPFSLKLVK